jgi:hypothetical protein
MPVNPGLLGGLGEGLQSFSDSFYKNRAYQDQLGLAKQHQQAGLIEHGIAQNDQGQLAYNPDLDPNIARAKVVGQFGIDKANVMANVYNQRLNTQQQRINQAASNNYKSEIGPLETQILQSDKIEGILGKARSGEITPSQVLSSEIAGSLNTMFTGKPSTVTGMSEAEYKSAAGKFNNLAGFITGDPQAAVTPQQLDQYLKEVQALRGEYLGQHKAKFNSFIQRQPEETRDLLNNSYNQFRSSYDQGQPSGRGLIPHGSGGGGQQQQPQVDFQKAIMDELARRKGGK